MKSSRTPSRPRYSFEESVQIVVLVLKYQGYRVKGYAVYNGRASIVVDGWISEPEEFQQDLNLVLAMNGVRAVVEIVPGEKESIVYVHPR